MPNLSQLARAAGVPPAFVDAMMPYLTLQRANQQTDFTLIGNPNAPGNAAPKIFHVHQYFLAQSSFFRQYCQRPFQLSPIPVYGMDIADGDIQRLIDFMYLGVYGDRAVEFRWRKEPIADLFTHVRMYKIGVSFGIPSLESFALQAIALKFPSAVTQDVERAIDAVWKTPDENDDLRTMLIQCEFATLRRHGLTPDQWLDWFAEMPDSYRNPAYQREFREAMEGRIYLPWAT